jgi:hypothetical protein
LCPVLWVSRNGAVQIMRAAEPLTEMMSYDEYGEAVDAWDYMPGEDECPFEPKASDWGWFEGRRVALDYSTPAWGRGWVLAELGHSQIQNGPLRK